MYAQPGNVDYSVNVGVDRVLVEVDRDGVPADGQSPVKVVVQLYGADGKPMAGDAFATIEHSGGRIKLADGRTVAILATGDPLCHGLAAWLEGKLDARIERKSCCDLDNLKKEAE